jgi:hypothetical protein
VAARSLIFAQGLFISLHKLVYFSLDVLADKLQQEHDQIKKKTSDQARIDLELSRRDHEHALDTIRQDREQINMLTALTHQLTEKITPALPPSQEEAKKKGWWQFWR